MKYDPALHNRRSIRLKGYDYSRSGAYFVTICVQNREHLFGKIENGRIILNYNGNIVSRCWFDLVNHYENIGLDDFVIMPNHFHGIINITGHGGSGDDCGGGVGAIHELPLHELPLYELPLRELPPQEGAIHELPLQAPPPQQRRQMLLSKIMGRFKMVTSKQINISRKLPGVPVWQRNYWEHIVRNENEFSRIRQYIKNNPILWEHDKLNGGLGNRVMEPQTEYGEESWMV
jgi:REP element-mobilizing transposase RayT